MGRVVLDPGGLDDLSQVWSRAGDELLDLQRELAAIEGDGALLSAVPFAPRHVAEVHQALLPAVFSPQAVGVLGARLKGMAVGVQAVRTAALTADSVAGWPEDLQHLLSQGVRAGQRAFTGSLPAVAQAAHHAQGPTLFGRVPWIPEHVATALDGEPVLAAFGLTQDALSRLLPEGRGVAAPLEVRHLDDFVAPVGLADLYQRMTVLRDGQIAVIRLDGDPPRWAVVLRGIASMGNASHPQDLYGAVIATNGPTSAYTRAVTDAMRRAAVPAGAQVMLVGHSQGGIAAMTLAADPAFNGGLYDVTHVVAAGSPISGKRPAQPGTRVLDIENRHDVVPYTDFTGSEHQALPDGWVTWQFDRDTGSVGENHSIAETYQQVMGPAPRADALSPSQTATRDSLSPAFLSNPGVGDFLESAAPYLSSGATTTTEYFALTDGALGNSPQGSLVPELPSLPTPSGDRLGPWLPGSPLTSPWGRITP